MAANRLTKASRALVPAALAACLQGPAMAGDADPVTPYRPSVSSPAQLPVAGQLEMEVGGLRIRSGTGAGSARRDSLPLLLKLAFSSDWGLLLGADAYVAVRDGGTQARGFGDTNLVVKRAWGIDDATAFGVELGVKLPTARDTLGSGKTDATLNAIYSRDLGPVHMDTNLNATRLGAVDAGTGRMQVGASASFSTPLSAQWGATVELSGTRRRGADSSVQLLTALTYSPSKRLSFDIGVARSARPAPGATAIFGGVVFPVASLW